MPTLRNLKGGVQTGGDLSFGQKYNYPPNTTGFYYYDVGFANLCMANYQGGDEDQTAYLNAISTPDSQFALAVSFGNAITGQAPDNTSVGTSSGSALAANTSRRYALFTNTDSSETIYLALNGETAVVDKGIILGPGAAFEMSLGAGNLSTGQVNAIASAAATNLAIMEGE